MNQVIVLDIDFTYEQKPDRVYPVLLIDDQEMILIDCGYPDFLPLIQQAAKRRHINLDRLTKIILTHHDFDHIGALPAFKEAYPDAQILCHEDEVPYINGSLKPLRLQRLESVYPQLPEPEKNKVSSFTTMIESVKPVAIDQTLHDGERFSWCSGVEIIHTPGHMPGHISLYLYACKTLIAGDALVVKKDELSFPFPEYTYDIPLAKKSIRKLQNYDIKRIICYHGGLYDKDIEHALKII